jgi:hypothetical protein
MISSLISGLSAIPEVDGIVLGGSRGIHVGSTSSDYDIALYRSCDKPIPSEVIAEHLPKDLEVNINPILITGFIGELKFEIFQKNLTKIEQEIINNQQGKFRWTLAPLLPFGDVSYRIVSHLVNSDVLYDRGDKLKSIIDRVEPLPALFKKSVVNHFVKQMNNATIHLDKVNKSDDQFHFMSLIGLILFCYINILFVINNRYPIIEKGNFTVAQTLPKCPENFTHKISTVYSTAASFDFVRSRKFLKDLIIELKHLIHETQKKQNQ